MRGHHLMEGSTVAGFCRSQDARERSRTAASSAWSRSSHACTDRESSGSQRKGEHP